MNTQIALERGKLLYHGSSEQFLSSPIMETLIQSKHANLDAGAEEVIETVEDVAENLEEAKETGLPAIEQTTMTVAIDGPVQKPKAPKKLIEDEARVVGRIGKDVWTAYLTSAGGPLYWVILSFAMILASLDPVAENGWIKFVFLVSNSRFTDIFRRVWSGAVNRGDTSRSPLSYITIYALVRLLNCSPIHPLT